MTTPNYKEAQLTGQSWQRCHQIVIENPRAGPASVRFEEERVLALDGSAELRTPAGALALDFDPARPIPLRDPATGDLTGQTTTYGAAYALLYSAYIDAALARDAANAPDAPEA